MLTLATKQVDYMATFVFRPNLAKENESMWKCPKAFVRLVTFYSYDVGSMD
jgi:hypothetical protein